MDFYESLDEAGRIDLLKRVDYCPMSFKGQEKGFAFIDELRRKPSSKVLIISDPDVDGLMSALINYEFLKQIGIYNVHVHAYCTRDHSIDKTAILECIQQKYDYCIISDTGSSEMDSLLRLNSYGIKVLVLDHHVTENQYSDYPKDVAILNTIIENRMEEYDKFALSAGALCFSFFDAYCAARGLDRHEELSTYALVSLYSDCMDMSNKLNRSIYYLALEVDRTAYPIFIQHFLSNYQSFNSRFISYWFAPRVNALFRSERFDIINDYFFNNDITSIEKAKYIEYINAIYENDREKVNILSDITDVVEIDNFVISDLGSALQKSNLEFFNVQNYTGLIANKLCERYGKTAIVYLFYNNYYKASLRDLYGRNYLNLFQQLCYAGGHDSAFGMKIRLLELNNFLSDLTKIDQLYHIDTISNEPIIIPYEFQTPDSVLIEDMATYNEFSGNKVPVALLKKSLVGGMREQMTKYYYRYYWGDYFVQSDYHLDFGTKMILKPIRSSCTKLLYQA